MKKIPWLVVSLAGLWSSVASGSPIFYEVTDVADTAPGVDLWRYDYTIGNDTPFHLSGFTIYFDFDLYDFNLIEDSPGSGDFIVDPADSTAPSGWDAFVAPDADILGVQEDGFFDLFNPFDVIEPGAPLISGFSVTFAYTGSGTPGSQFFEYFGVDASGAAISGSSFTQLLVGPAPVSEPGMLLTFVIGLLALNRHTKYARAG